MNSRVITGTFFTSSYSFHHITVRLLYDVSEAQSPVSGLSDGNRVSAVNLRGYILPRTSAVRRRYLPRSEHLYVCAVTGSVHTLPPRACCPSMIEQSELAPTIEQCKRVSFGVHV